MEGGLALGSGLGRCRTGGGGGIWGADLTSWSPCGYLGPSRNTCWGIRAPWPQTHTNYHGPWSAGLNFLSPPTGNLWSEELRIFWDAWLRRHGRFQGHQAPSPSLGTDFPGGGMRRLARVTFYRLKQSFPGASAVKNLPANAAEARDMGSVPWLGRSPGIGNVNPLHCSCLGNPMDRGAWHAAVLGAAKSQT